MSDQDKKQEQEAKNLWDELVDDSNLWPRARQQGAETQGAETQGAEIQAAEIGAPSDKAQTKDKTEAAQSSNQSPKQSSKQKDDSLSASDAPNDRNLEAKNLEDKSLPLLFTEEQDLQEDEKPPLAAEDSLSKDNPTKDGLTEDKLNTLKPILDPSESAPSVSSQSNTSPESSPSSDTVHPDGVSSKSIPATPLASESEGQAPFPTIDARKADRRQSGSSFMRPLFVFGAIGLFSIGGLGGGFFAGYETGYNDGLTHSPSILKAEKGIVRQKPNDPEGLDVPHKDSPSYGAVSGNGISSSSEGEASSGTMTTTEAPLNEKELSQSSSVDDPGEPQALVSNTTYSEFNAPQPPKASPKASEDLATSQAQRPQTSETGHTGSLKDANNLKPQEESASKTLAEKLAKALPSSSTSEQRADKSTKDQGEYRVQLASHLTASMASIEATRYEKRYQGIVDRLEVIEKIVSGKVRYQVKSQPMSADMAQTTCSTIKARGGDCFISR